MTLEHKQNGHHDSPRSDHGPLRWESAGVAAVPYRVFFEPEIYELNSIAFFADQSGITSRSEAELPNPCDFKTAFVGDTSIVLTRAAICNSRLRQSMRSSGRDGLSHRARQFRHSRPASIISGAITSRAI